ncbi:MULTISPECIES: hypothetical protein [Streptosporangium]|uniref:Uncharacterized protein n=1 Tax=Streptosporangium brasiliense TaxID=47480 RepID=A0ABT9RBC7_9ACTN|nr:hypothetical protein [Streptosporangium brasiliense]MDP9866562.1 hypothetical protein [Streptosporangium brasiliense]
MKLFFAGLVATAAAVSAVAVPAQAASVASVQAAPVDPVKALKAQLVPGRGVKITESSGIILDFTADDRAMQIRVNTRTVGTLAFGKGNAAAADLRVRMSSPQKGSNPPYRVIAEGRNAYVTNAGIAKALPSGRSWIQSKASGHRNAVPDIVTPAELKFMLDNASEVATGEYQGTATLADFQHDRSAGEGSVEFRLYFDEHNLLTHTVVDTTTYPDDDTMAYDQMVFHTDTKYSGWGTKVKIAAPAASKVISEKKLNAKTLKAAIKAGYPESGPF